MSRMQIHYDGRILALVRNSIGTHSTKRPLTPIEVSKYLRKMKDELHDDSHIQLAEMFQVAPITIKQLIDMSGSPARYHDVWGWGTGNSGRIPWSQFREACDFFTKKIISEDEFGMLVVGALNKQVGTSDIREIVRLKKKNPDMAFEKCYREILNMVPKITKSVVFIADLDPAVLDGIRVSAGKKAISDEDVAISALSKILGSKDVEDVAITNNRHIKIALTWKGRKRLGDVAQKDNQTLADVVNHIFIKAGYGSE